MSAFNALNGVPASANAFTLGQILREEWRFRGFVVSDWTSIAETIAHGTAIDGAEAARKSIAAGVDMDMESDLYRTALADEVEGRQAADRDDRPGGPAHPARQIRHGPVRTIPMTGSSRRKRCCREHRQLAREAAEKSFVLLKNDGVLPLQAGARIALIGPLADSAARHARRLERQRRGRRRDHLARCAGGKARHVAGLCKGHGDIRRFRQRLCRGGRGCPGAPTSPILALGENAPEMTGEAASRTRARPARQPAGAAGRGRGDRQAGGAAGVQRTAAGADAGRRAGRRNHGGLVPRRGGGSGAGAHSLRGQQSERPADGEFPARGRAGAALLQSAQHRPAAASGIQFQRDRPAGKVPVALHRPGKHAALSVRIRALLHEFLLWAGRARSLDISKRRS